MEQSTNADPYDLSVTEPIDYLVKLEQVDKLRRSDPDKYFNPNEGKHQQTTNMI
jgi:hypothetical protein